VKYELIESADRVSVFLKALAGRSRLLLLCHLWEGEKSVGELARLTSSRDTAVSQQLALLRRQGMVKARRSGQTIFYSLSSDEVIRILDALQDMFANGGVEVEAEVEVPAKRSAAA
jgi:ArsR family transcriptional regulator, virulence genes transcriptional regulator